MEKAIVERKKELKILNQILLFKEAEFVGVLWQALSWEAYF